MTENTCFGREESIHRLLDNDLSYSEREEFSAHLASCAACQTLLAELQELFEDLESMPEVEAPADLVTRVMTQLPKQQPSPQRLNLGALVLAGQATIGLILLLLSWPVLALAVDQTLWLQINLVLADIIGSIQTGFLQLAADLSDGIHGSWLFYANLIGFDLTPTFTLAVVTGLILAWLVGNGLLLRGKSPSIGNGGTS